MGIYHFLYLHSLSIEDTHGSFIVMILLCSITTRISDKKITIIEGNALRFVAHLCGSNHFKCRYINLSHIALFKILKATSSQALMTIACHIDILSIRAQLPVVGNILNGSYFPTLWCDKLYDIRPVDGNSNEVVVYLDDIIRCITNLLAILITKPMVAHHVVLFKVGHTAVVCLPHAFVQHNQFLLGFRGDSQQER